MQRRRFLAVVSAAAVTAGLRPAFVAGQAVRSDPGPAHPVMDCHIHPMSDALHDLIAPFVSRQGVELKRFGGTEIVAYLDGLGATHAYALSSAYLWAGRRPGEQASEFAVKPGEYENVQAENNFVAAQAAEFPGRIVPFMSINPLKPYAVDELERCDVELEMRGLKLHFWNSGVNLREPGHVERIQPVFEYVASRDLPVMLHFYNGGVEDFGPRDVELFATDILVNYPDLRICFAHFLGAGNYADVVGDSVDALVQISDENPGVDRGRLFLDLAAIFNRDPRGRFAGVSDGQLARLGEQISAWGTANILWGSDNREDYLAVTRAMWPLGDAELRRIMQNDGSAFLGPA